MDALYDIGDVVTVAVVFRDRNGITTDPTTVAIAALNPLKQVVTGTVGQDATTIAAGSNGLALPQSTIYVAALPPYLPAPFAGQTNTVLVTTSAGVQTVTYTGFVGGLTPALTGCSGGTGTMSTGGAVTPVGVWHADFAQTCSGRWAYSFSGTGAVVAAGAGEWTTRVQEVPP